tara:strand:- start:45 stop:239 length:195 start_codon:yes stop_codon:yes gene_type:complete
MKTITTNRKKDTMQKTIIKYQKRFDKLIMDIEKDKILRKMPGNHVAGIAVQMVKNLNGYLKANK